MKWLAEAARSAQQASATVVELEGAATAPKENHVAVDGVIVRVDLSGDKPAVSARELHEFLGVETEYRHWFPRMCEYGFIEGQDFNPVNFDRVRKEGDRMVSRPIDDAAISIDMAKEICMLQRNEKGKQARQYFLQLERDWNSPEQVMARAIKLADRKIQSLEGEVSELKRANGSLTLSNAMLAKEEQHWEPSKVVNRLIRVYSSVVFGNNFQLGWADFHRELQYRKNINLKLRSGTSSLIKRIRDDEWRDVIAVAAAMCQSSGVDPAEAINYANAEFYLAGEVCNVE